MAYTVTKLADTVFGNYRVRALDILADGATAGIDSGLKKVEFFQMSPVSLSSAAIKIYKNAGATGTAIAGYLGVSGVTSGDRFIITVYGN